MDGGSKPADGNPSYLVPRWVALTTAAVFAIAVVLVGVIAYHISPSCIPSLAPIAPADPFSLPKTYPYVRLPRSVHPVHYDITIRPDFANFTFAGKVGVTVRCMEVTHNVTLHVNNVTVSGVTLGGREVGWEEDKEKQFLVLRPKEVLSAGRTYRLEVEYEGVLNDQLAGFYRSSYQDAQGGEKR